MTYIRDTFSCSDLHFLPQDLMQAAVGEDVTIVSFGGDFLLSESNEDTAARYLRTYHRLLTEHYPHSVLCVTHWDGVMRLATEVMNHTPGAIYAHVAECGFLVLKAEDRRPLLAHDVNLVMNK